MSEQLRIIPAREPGEIIQRAIEQEKPSRLYVLFSGGKDSTVVLDYLWKTQREYIEGAVHIRTGISVPQTLLFAAQFCQQRGIPFYDMKTTASFDDMVRQHGFPGPAMHGIYYNELKGDVVARFVQEAKRDRNDRIGLITGVRVDESKRRAQTSRDVQRKGASVWIAPCIDWTTPQCVAYREENAVPISEAATTLCMSGDCLCGAKSDTPDEIKPIELFYPSIAERLHALERELKPTGNCRWQYANGIRGGEEPKAEDMPLCVGCLKQPSLFEEPAA